MKLVEENPVTGIKNNHDEKVQFWTFIIWIKIRYQPICHSVSGLRLDPSVSSRKVIKAD